MDKKIRYYNIVCAVAQILNDPQLAYCRLRTELTRRFPRQDFDEVQLKDAWRDFSHASNSRYLYAKAQR